MSLQVATTRFAYDPEPVWALRDQQPVTTLQEKDNWFMRRITKDIVDGAPPTIIIGGPKRLGKTWMSLKIAQEIEDRCHMVKYAYRDRGMPTEIRYDLRKAQFDVTKQLLFSLRTIPELLQPPPPLGTWLPYGSVIISDESSVNLNALSFNSPIVKRVSEIHDTAGYRLVSWIMNVPGSVARVTYQLRETASYFMQMKARGVAKVYEARPWVTGRVGLKTIGWLGYMNPFTKRVLARIGPPKTETLRAYYVMKDFWFNRLLARSGQRMAALAAEGWLGPFDDPSDYKDTTSIATITAMKQRHHGKHEIPNRALDISDVDEDELP